VSTQELRITPMSTGMVLDGAFRLYAQNFPLMLGITAILNVPLLLVTGLMTAPILFPGVRSPLGTLAALAGALGTLVGFLIVYPLITGAMTKAVSERYLGNPVTVGSALKEAWGSIGTLLLNQMIVGIVVAVGFLLLVVPGILWMLSYSLVVPVAILETRVRHLHSLTGDSTRTTVQSPDRAEIRRRSWKLVQGNRGKVFAVLAVFFVMQMLLAYAASLIVQGSFQAGSSLATIFQSMTGNVVNILVYPLQTIAVTLLYYDLRIRKEGFDLEMLSHAIGSPAINS